VACISLIQQVIRADYNPAYCPVLPPNVQLISVWKKVKRGKKWLILLQSAGWSLQLQISPSAELGQHECKHGEIKHSQLCPLS
jgi:hypothetical protein